MASKIKSPQFLDTNSIETLREVNTGIRDIGKDLGTGIAKTIVNDVAKDTIKGMWEQIFATSEKPSMQTQGELKEGQELVLGKPQRTEVQEARPVQTPDILPAYDYRREILYGKTEHKAEVRTLEIKIQEIIIELKQLTTATKELELEFKDVSVQQYIAKPGKYHLAFFEWMISAVRSARMRIEDSSAWLSALKSKKTGKGYWDMFKKHGTSFGLSGERTVATQAG